MFEMEAGEIFEMGTAQLFEMETGELFEMGTAH